MRRNRWNRWCVCGGMQEVTVRSVSELSLIEGTHEYAEVSASVTYVWVCVECGAEEVAQ